MSSRARREGRNMSEPSNRLLLQPAPEGLVAALTRASTGTRASEHNRQWQPLLDEVAANAEGRSQIEHHSPGHEGTQFVCVAWWTDHQGRKLVRVCGGHTEWGPQRHFSRLDRD